MPEALLHEAQSTFSLLMHESLRVYDPARRAGGEGRGGGYVHGGSCVPVEARQAVEQEVAASSAVVLLVRHSSAHLLAGLLHTADLWQILLGRLDAEDWLPALTAGEGNLDHLQLEQTADLAWVEQAWAANLEWKRAEVSRTPLTALQHPAVAHSQMHWRAQVAQSELSFLQLLHLMLEPCGWPAQGPLSAAFPHCPCVPWRLL